MNSLLSFDGLHQLVADLPENHERTWIPGGQAGTAATIDRMQELVSVGKRDFELRKVVGSILQKCKQKDYYCYAKSIFEFCQNDIKYAFDPNGVELLEHPMQILKSKIADCDSICILFCSMCESIGLVCRFVTIKADSSRPDEFSHVFCEVKIPRRGWVTADCTMKHPFGWTPPKDFPRQEWPSSKDKSDDGHEGDAMAGFFPVVQSSMNIPGVERGTRRGSVNPEGEFRIEDAITNASQGQIEVSVVKHNTGKRPWEHYGKPQFFTQNAPKALSGLDNLSAISLGSAEVMAGIYSGAVAEELKGYYQQFKIEIPQKISRFTKDFSVLGMAEKVANMSLLSRLQRANADALTKTLEAIQGYDRLVKAISTVSMGYTAPTTIGLSGNDPSETVISSISMLPSVSLQISPFVKNFERARIAALEAKRLLARMESAGKDAWATWTLYGLIALTGGYLLLKGR